MDKYHTKYLTEKQYEISRIKQTNDREPTKQIIVNTEPTEVDGYNI